jgi:hypothetical protein
MDDRQSVRGVIPAHAVKRVEHPVLVDCGAEPGKTAISVVPILDGGRVAGFEVRCRCGATVIVECVYEEKP